MAGALHNYDKIEKITENWNRHDLMVELACARSVILDEGLNRFEDAISAIDVATERFGAQPKLLRQKSKVLANAGQHAEATDLFLSVEDEVGLDSPLDRALALRDGGISAAQAKRFADAVRLLGKAEATLQSKPENRAFAVGIVVEKGLILWSSGAEVESPQEESMESEPEIQNDSEEQELEKPDTIPPTV